MFGETVSTKGRLFHKPVETKPPAPGRKKKQRKSKNRVQGGGKRRGEKKGREGGGEPLTRWKRGEHGKKKRRGGNCGVQGRGEVPFSEELNFVGEFRREYCL